MRFKIAIGRFVRLWKRGERHDSFKERVKSVDHDHHESGQGEGQPVVL